MSYHQIILSLLGNKCFICKSTNNLVIHHKDRNRKNNDINNLLLLCRECHNVVHKKLYLKNK